MGKEDFQDTGELVKELGLKEALTIGIGTMIGAGIFVLPRYAIELAGPGAIFSYIIAGIVCIITAASMAELATGMPKSGGAYFFISRSMGTFMGTISGVSVWFSLTFAVAFYLRGFGEYMAMALPVNEVVLAIIAGIFFTYINYIGAKETGKTQNIIVGILLVILALYTIIGFFNIDAANLSPFFPEGMDPVIPATAIIFVSFLGFDQIASVAEEIKDPSNTLPKAIIGSVAIVVAIYALVLFVMSGALPYRELSALEAPVVETARVFSGFIGVVAITFAALLATASSANASILASSRISFALGRDNILPKALNKVHPKFLTPYRPILLTGALTIFFIVTADVEALSSSASVLMLINYFLINFTIVVMRLAPPEGYEPSYRAPGFPILQILGGIASLAIVFMAGTFAQIIAAALMLVSLVWFLVWARSRSEVRGAIKDVKWSNVLSLKDLLPKEAPDFVKSKVDMPEVIDDESYKILTPMANPNTEASMLKIAAGLTKNIARETEVKPLSVVEVPEQTPLDFAANNEELLKERHKVQQEMFELALEFGEQEGIIISPQILYSRDRFSTIYNMVIKESINFLLLGWHGSFSISNIYSSLVKNLVRRARCPVGVLKDNGLEETKQILVPYRGSEHAYYGVKIAQRLAWDYEDGQVTILRVIKAGADAEAEKKKALAEVEDIITDNVDIEVRVVVASKVVDGIITETVNNNYDLIIMGASKEWRFKNMLFGSVPDIVAEKSDTSVLMVRCYDENVKEIEEKIELEEEKDEEAPAKF